MFKKFKYSILKKNKNKRKSVLFNTLNNKIDKYSCIDDRLIDEYKKSLLASGHYVDKDIDDGELAKYFLRRYRVQNNLAQFICFITNECNFSCDYCFNVESRGEASSESLEKIVLFISRIVESRKIEHSIVHIMGGEPLLNPGGLRKFLTDLNSLRESRGISLQTNLVTNGFLLTSEKLKEVSPYSVDSAQITFDGHREYHDLKRFVSGGIGSFDRIVSNIKDVGRDLELNIRVNVDLENIDSLKSILDILVGLGDYINKIYLAPIVSTSMNHLCTSSALLEDDYSGYLKLNELSDQYGLGPVLPPMGSCLDFFENNYSISTNGDIYTCPNFINNKSLSVGNVRDGSFGHKYFSIMNSERWQNCYSCNYLLLCLGGCRDKAFQKTGDINGIDCNKEAISCIVDGFLEKKICDD